MYIDKILTRSQKWLLGLVCASSILIIPFQNCSALRSPNGEDEVNQKSSASESDVLGKQAMDILSSKCLTCHNPENPQGGVSDITDLNYLLYYRLVIPGQPEISDIIRVIKEGSMPPSGNLSTAELQSLNRWILEGLIDSSGNVTIPGGSATLEPRYSSIKVRILNTKCLGCHSGANLAGGVDLSTYATTRANNIVVPGNPGGSRLVTSLERVGNDFMPRNGARLTTAEITIIRQWITDGGLDN